MCRVTIDVAEKIKNQNIANHNQTNNPSPVVTCLTDNINTTIETAHKTYDNNSVNFAQVLFAPSGLWWNWSGDGFVSHLLFFIIPILYSFK